MAQFAPLLSVLAGGGGAGAAGGLGATGAGLGAAGAAGTAAAGLPSILQGLLSSGGTFAGGGSALVPGTSGLAQSAAAAEPASGLSSIAQGALNGISGGAFGQPQQSGLGGATQQLFSGGGQRPSTQMPPLPPSIQQQSQFVPVNDPSEILRRLLLGQI